MVRSSTMRTRTAGLIGATALAGLCSAGLVPALLSGPAQAQGIAGIDGAQVSPNANMLLEADTLTFDNDSNIVTAAGGVQIEYDGNRLVADQVTYNRNTNRLVASGDVEIVDRDGNKYSSEQIDVTDDFADGFINSLQVETVDKTYFGAESARRENDNTTTFNNGVYTACAPCADKPGKPPIWRVKSQTIVWNQQKKTIRFSNARFEMFGLPIAYFPFLEVPDPTVKRKTGFLFPGFGYKSELGAGVTVPFYIALAPTYDMTMKGTGWTNQGFLGEVEWRQRFNNGQYTIRAAGIRQMNPDAFDNNTVDRGIDDSDPNKNRFMVGTKGDFRINPRWTFGWDVLAQTDKNFSYTYGIEDYSEYVHDSNVYLTGLNDRNLFDLRGIYFQVQEEYPTFNPGGSQNVNAVHERQPWVLPTFDYSYTPDEPIAGGELNIDINSRVLYRNQLDAPLVDLNPDNDPNTAPTLDPNSERVIRGIEGTNTRTTAEAEWKRSFITPGGLVITPLLHVQADATTVDTNATTLASLNTVAANINAATDVRSSYYRTMATAGLEARWPVLFSTSSATHVLEPMGQIFARPDEDYATTLGIPNEDAQSMVFDATTLFDRDKFSGYDRIEGGTRANLGIRYSGAYANGWTTNALVGQSFHLAGVNSYAGVDLVSAGAFSGLETDVSDYVGMLGFSTPYNLSMSAAGRFDEETFEMRRGELRAFYGGSVVKVSGKYAYIQSQPLYGFPNDRQEVTLGGTLQFHENWTARASGTYDIESEVLVSDTFGLAYGDECFVFGLSLTRDRNPTTKEVSSSVGFTLSFRTIGDFGSTTASLE